MAIDCLCAGILVADHLCAPIPKLPEAGHLVLADRLVLNIGGCASNAAMDLVRAGVSVGVVGCVGLDTLGRFVCETLEAGGIDTRGVRRLADVGTSATLIVNVAGQDRRYIHSVGANAAFTAEDIPMDLVRQSKVLYVGGYLLMSKLSATGLREIFRQARAIGVKTVLDVVVPGPGDHWSAIAEVLPETDAFLPNRDEAELITGLADPVAQAEKFLAAGVGTAVITCGGDGTVLVSKNQRLKAGVYPVKYVDGSGSGDAFDAGYITGLIEGADPRRCLEWGSALGASCVRAIGTTAGVFTRAEAEEFMRANKLEVGEF